MQLIQKYVIVLSGLAVFLFLGYIAIQHPDAPQTDVATKVNTSISQSGIEMDTGKRLETLANSETSWGMNPFGSGKPLEEEKKLEFKKPNTEWKTRTLSGITYVFGEGNPKEVAKNADQIKVINSLCINETSSEARKLIDTEVCSQESGLMAYLTPEVEKYLLAALSDPNWKKLATECEKNFRFVEESGSAFTNAQNDPEYPLFDRVFSLGWLDMEHYLYIDPYTGLKLLKWGRVNVLAGFITTASHYGQRKVDGWINPYGDCVDQYGTEIARNLYSALELYKNPLTYTNGYTNQFIISKNFNLSQF